MLCDFTPAFQQTGDQQFFRVGVAKDHSRAVGGRNDCKVVAALLVGEWLRLPGFGMGILRSFLDQ
jgi:hypothetical protein